MATCRQNDIILASRCRQIDFFIYYEIFKFLMTSRHGIDVKMSSNDVKIYRFASETSTDPRNQLFSKNKPIKTGIVNFYRPNIGEFIAFSIKVGILEVF